ncbi:retinitis pigmentosa 1-like 1 protein [Salvelinus namaycush]|nr:retinitis pigmentosa 1-like 1 protein [Salvelinus namaycush]XP_038839381.1 retinitis pigmentosa 1-like 1 protein [Salvelinus namaycush]
MENKEFKESEVSGNDLTLIDLDDPINDGDVMKEDRSDKDHREVERQTTLEEAVLETDIQTLSLEAEGEIEMQEADLKTDGTSQSQKVEGEIELDDAVVIPPQSQEVEGECELDDAVVIPSQSQKVEGEIELDEAVVIPPQSQEVEGESELDEAVVIPSQSQEEAKGESELKQVDLKTATSTLTLEVEGESVMQESDDLQTAGTSQSQETERVAKAAVVTFTSVTRKAAASQTSLTLSRGKRSYPDLHTFVQDMKDG